MYQDGINVLSLFDGISGAYIALKKAGIKIKNYYSSEIDEHVLKIQDYHYSATTNFHKIGDVKDVDIIDYLATDLVIFGSPCTQLSAINTKDRSGLNGPDSSLFYEALRILKELKEYQYYNHKLYFLMENVASMSKENRDKITKELQNIFGDEVKLLKINSSLIAPANRRRLYWTNIPQVSIPKPNGIEFKDVLVNGYTDKEKANVILSSNVTLTNGLFRHYKMNLGNVIYKDEAFARLSPEMKLERYPEILKASGYDCRANRGGDEYLFPNGCYRLPSILELERMMTFPDEYVSKVPNVSRTQKQKALGLSFTVDIIYKLLTGLN